uniref:Reverse transcriptase RNase H-like domain-containing protein n=1 Tax=Tanacetum cinerariifolium TaxID=118510 RepID=A0A6L2JGK9_TANCI|nr:hypothetical protein [Tanacetum cinerariifolium]
MKELCQPSLNGRGGPIAPIAIQATNFGLKNDKIQQVQNSCQFHGLPDAKMFLGKYFPPSMVTKLRNEITNFHQRPDESLFEAWERGTFMKRRLEECYDLIENITDHHNDWDTSAQQSESSSSITSSSDTEIAALKAKMVKINKNLMRPPLARLKTYMLQEPIKGANQGQNQPAYQALLYQALVHQPQIPQPQVVTTNEFTNFVKANDAILKNMQTNMTSLTNSNLELKNMFGQFMKMNTASSSGSRTLPGNTVTNPKEDLKGITTRSGTAYPGPTIPTTSSSSVVESETEATKDTVHPTKNGSTEDVQPLVVSTESPILNSEPVNSSTIEPVASPVSALRPNQRPSIPYPSRLHDQKLRDKANDQREKFFQIFKDLNFNISFVDALILMPKSFLKTGRALIDVFEGKLTLRVGKEAITFNLDQTSRYSANYNDMTAKRIDVIDMACEDDFLLKEVDAFLAIEDDPTSPEIDQSYLDSEGDILLLEAFLNDDPSLPPPNQGNYMPEGIDPEFCTHKILMEEDFKPAVQHQRRVNPKIHDVIKQEVLKLLDVVLIYPISDSPWVSPIHCVPKKGGFTVVENEENDPGATSRKTFRPIHYASKTMTEAESNYTTTEKEMLVVVYAFEKFRSYLIMNKSNVYTDHSAHKYLFAKKDSKARLLRWVLVLQEFTFKVIDTKGAENLAADHLS